MLIGVLVAVVIVALFGKAGVAYLAIGGAFTAAHWASEKRVQLAYEGEILRSSFEDLGDGLKDELARIAVDWHGSRVRDTQLGLLPFWPLALVTYLVVLLARAVRTAEDNEHARWAAAREVAALSAHDPKFVRYMVDVAPDLLLARGFEAPLTTP